jgi:phosphate starvation-inducible PhoH-like protein
LIPIPSNKPGAFSYRMQKIIRVEDNFSLANICGVEDKNLKFLEKQLNIAIIMNPEGIILKGNKNNIEKAEPFLKKIMELNKEGIIFNQSDLERYIDTGFFSADNSSVNINGYKEEDKLAIRIPSSRKKFIFPKTEGQKHYIEAIKKYDIVFSTGPAGTGKTYLAMAMAVNYLMEKKVRRIILVRPAIEAGESLGFLPGDVHEKLGPYLRPLYDALYDMMEVEVIEDYLETGVIEIAPLAYMRGRTLNSAFIILDEAQNCTFEQLRMFLTRLGFESKALITGDITQSDLPEGKPTGLIDAINLLKSIKGIKYINLSKQDVVRHPLIQKIIQAYENFYSKKAS